MNSVSTTRDEGEWFGAVEGMFEEYGVAMLAAMRRRATSLDPVHPAYHVGQRVEDIAEHFSVEGKVLGLMEPVLDMLVGMRLVEAHAIPDAVRHISYLPKTFTLTRLGFERISGNSRHDADSHSREGRPMP